MMLKALGKWESALFAATSRFLPQEGRQQTVAPQAHLFFRG